MGAGEQASVPEGENCRARDRVAGGGVGGGDVLVTKGEAEHADESSGEGRDNGQGQALLRSVWGWHGLSLRRGQGERYTSHSSRYYCDEWGTRDLGVGLG